MEKELKPKKVKIRHNALIGQDLSYRYWDSPDIVFDIDESFNHPEGKRKCLVADGYGKSGNYGNGAVFADIDDLIDLIILPDIVESKEKTSREEELESMREYAWRLFQYYCEKLDELRKQPEEPGWKEEVHRIASVIGTKVKEGKN